jgi:UDP:flavonoid glycosyltransferase YjiC (YdhE family)
VGAASRRATARGETREAILVVLNQPAFRERARRMSELIGSHHDGRNAATELEVLVTK